MNEHHMRPDVGLSVAVLICATKCFKDWGCEPELLVCHSSEYANALECTDDADLRVQIESFECVPRGWWMLVGRDGFVWSRRL